MENEKVTKMPLMQKLAILRAHIASLELKKSGHNKHAGFNYYELGDFMPQTLKKMAELEIFGLTDFAVELFYVLTIYDTIDKEEKGISFFFEKAVVAIQGAQRIQNIAGEHSFANRYLWMDAIALSEPDTVDAMTGKNGNNQNTKQPDADTPKWIDKNAEQLILLMNTTEEIDAELKRLIAEKWSIGKDRMTRIEARKKALSELKQTSAQEVTPPATVKKPDEDILFATLEQMNGMLATFDPILLKDKKDKILQDGGHFTKIQNEQLVAHFKKVSELSGKIQPKHDLDEIFDAKKTKAEAMTEITATEEELNQLNKLL